MKKRKIVSYIVAAGMFIFLLVEGGARFFLGLGTPPLSVSDEEIEYMFKPNQDIQRFGNRQYYNAYGIRSVNFPKEKPQGEYRIIVFGDSVLNGGNQTDQSELATTLLQESLTTAWKRPVVVGNVSAGSWGPPNMAAYARKFGLFGADQVIIQLSSHDITDVPTFAPLNPFTHPTKNPCCAIWEGITRYVPRFVPALKPILQPASAQEDLFAAPKLDMEEGNVQKSFQALSDLLSLTKRKGGQLFLVLHADRDEAAGGVYKPGHDLFISWAKEHVVPVLDMGSIETESLKDKVDPYRKNDGIHLSAIGQKIWAKELHKYLIQSTQLVH